MSERIARGQQAEQKRDPLSGWNNMTDAQKAEIDEFLDRADQWMSRDRRDIKIENDTLGHWIMDMFVYEVEKMSHDTTDGWHLAPHNLYLKTEDGYLIAEEMHHIAKGLLLMDRGFDDSVITEEVVLNLVRNLYG